MDEHIERILKMLEEGKISAENASSLISALRTEAKPGSSTAPGTSRPSNGQSDTGASKSAASQPESAKSKSFEFQWSQKRGLPFDLSGLGKQISDAVKKIDPERLVREARTGWSRGGKRWNERFKGFGWFVDFEDGRPENTLGQPTARTTETLMYDLAAGA